MDLLNCKNKALIKCHRIVKDRPTYGLICMFFIISNLLFLSGCKPNPTSSPDAINNPSNLSVMGTQTPTPLFIIPTNTIIPDTIPNNQVPAETYPYSHPDGIFTIQAPMNWIVNQTLQNITFTDPLGEQEIYTQVIYTGYQLDEESFTRLIENRESTNAYQFDRYVIIDRQNMMQNNTTLIMKSYYDQEKIKNVTSYYQSLKNSVIILDFEADEEIFSNQNDLFKIVYSSIQINEEAIRNKALYFYDQANTHSNGYFSISIPFYWDFRRIEENYTIIETFTSPDEQAIIQSLIYDDGKPVTKKIAGELTLALLKNNYTKRIYISKDEVLKDGREKITWSSLDNDYQGITSFTTRGTAIYILTIIWGSDPELYYQNILFNVFDSYIPDNLSE